MPTPGNGETAEERAATLWKAFNAEMLEFGVNMHWRGECGPAAKYAHYKGVTAAEDAARADERKKVLERVLRIAEQAPNPVAIEDRIRALLAGGQEVEGG